METVQKLDTILIEDKYRLSADELLKRAVLAAEEDARENGWKAISVVSAAIQPEQRGEYMRYHFDVFGTPSESTNANQGTTSKSTSTQPKAAASPEAEV